METQTKNKHQEILSMFVSKDKRDKDYREWMLTPFIINNKAIATDAICMAIINKELVEGIGELKGAKPENVLRAIPKERSEIKTIRISEIVNALKQCPMIDDYDEVGEDKECNACGGEGEVEYEFYYNGTQHYSESECPICDGDGWEQKTKKVPNGKKIYDKSKTIKIHQSLFYPEVVNKIVEVAKIINAEEISLVFQSSKTSTNVFKIADIELLAMPVASEKDENTIYV